MVRHAEILAEFSSAFGVPFLLGEHATVGSPLGQDGLLALRPGIAIDVGLRDAVDRMVGHSAHTFDVTPAPFDEDAGTLLYAVHELFACTHPQASAFYARAHLFCRAAAEAVRALPRTFGARRIVTRHLIVERAFAATRTDIAVRWWTGHAEFYGAEVPKRLTAWPGVRRVQSDTQITPMWKLALAAGDEDLRVARAALLVGLLDASPLTRLMLLGDAAQKALGFSLLLPGRSEGRRVSPLDVLEDPRIARAVCDGLLARGLEHAGPALALALLQVLREGAPVMLLRRTVETCAHLALLSCLVEAEAPGAKEARALRTVLEEDPARMNDAVRVFWAVVGAAFALDGRGLDLPKAAALPGSAGALWERLAKQLAHKKVRAVSEPLERQLHKQLLARRDDAAPAELPPPPPQHPATAPG